MIYRSLFFYAFERDGNEIAVVYFRTGYDPNQYKDEKVKLIINKYTNNIISIKRKTRIGMQG